MTAMQRSFRSRGGLPWWWWRHYADRRARSGGGGTPVDPLDAIFGALSGWYPVTLANTWKDAAGTVACTADGDLVAAWTATKGGLPMLVQATVANQPVLKADGGGRWRLDFDGAGDTMQTGTTVVTDIENLLAVAYQASSQASINFLLRTGTATTNAHWIQGQNSGQRCSGNFRFSSGTVYTAVSGIDAFPLNTPNVASSKLYAATIGIAKDKGTAVTAAAVPQAIAAGRIAVSPVGGTTRICGIAVHRAASISTDERATIITALAALQGRSI
jgi:hypothetical protein